MKKLAILVSFLLSVSYPQNSDFKVNGAENSPSTFLKEHPAITTTNSNNFIISWIDYREGIPQTFSQKFDRNGNKIGDNFTIPLYTSFYLNKDGFLLSLRKSSGGGGIDVLPYFTFFSGIYNQSNTRISEQQIGGGQTDWCGTGYIYGGQVITSQDSNFYFLSNEGGDINFAAVKTNGDVIIPSIDLGSNYVTQITASANPKNNYFFAWINGFSSDTMETGLYATFINHKDSISTKTIFIKSLENVFDNWGYISAYNLKSVSLNDSTYKLFWRNDSTYKLYSVELNTNGEVLTAIDSIQLPGLYEEQKLQMSITNKSDDGFYLIFNSEKFDSQMKYKNYLIKFDSEGKQSGEIISGETEERLGKTLFYAGSDIFYAVSTDNRNVYINKYDHLNKISSSAINDDESGSNEENISLVKYDDDNVFSIYKNEEKTYGVKISENGETGQPKEIDFIKVSFFKNGEAVAPWVKKNDKNKTAAGFAVYDKDLNKIFSKELSSVNNEYFIETKVISDSVFIIVFRDSSGLKLIKAGSDGNIIKEKFISRDQNFNHLRAFFDTSVNFAGIWLIWGNHLEKYSFDLEPLQVKENKYYLHYYLGEDKFLTISEEKDNTVITISGKIVNPDFEELTDKMVFERYFEEFARIVLVQNILSLGNRGFIYTNQINNTFVSKFFAMNGTLLKDTILTNSSSKKELNYLRSIVNKNKIYFTWSDTRNEGKGYDVYGNIFELSGLTDAAASAEQIPTDFALFQNYPNPFNPETIIKYSLPQQSYVKICLYDVLGRRMKTLFSGTINAGLHEVNFHAEGLSSGIYLYSIEADYGNGVYRNIKKMILLK